MRLLVLLLSDFVSITTYVISCITISPVPNFTTSREDNLSLGIEDYRFRYFNENIGVDWMISGLLSNLCHCPAHIAGLV